MIEINRNPTPRDLFWFGLLLPAAWGAIGAVCWFRFGAREAAIAIWAATAAVSLAYWCAAPLRRRMYVAWMVLTFPLLWLSTALLLAAAYYLVLTPIGLLLRLAGHDALTRRFDRTSKSYWRRREPPPDARQYFRQF